MFELFMKFCACCVVGAISLTMISICLIGAFVIIDDELKRRRRDKELRKVRNEF